MRLYPFGWLPQCSGIFASLQHKAHLCLFLVNLNIEKDGLLLSLKKENQAKHSAEFKHISRTSLWQNSLTVIGRQLNTGLKEVFWSLMFGKHGVPTCLSQSMLKFQSVEQPSKYSNKHSNSTTYLTAGHVTWKVVGQLTMEDWTWHLRPCASTWYRTNLHQMHSKVTRIVTCFNGIRMFGVHGPKVTDIISKKIGTKRATSTIPKDPPIQLPRKTTKGCTGPRLHTMSYWPQWMTLRDANLPIRTHQEPTCWSRPWDIEWHRLRECEEHMLKWCMRPLATSLSRTPTKLDDGWPESGGRWSFEDVNISSCKVVIIIAWWNLEDDKIRTVWLDDEDPNVWRQDVVSKYEDLKMKVKM